MPAIDRICKTYIRAAFWIGHRSRTRPLYCQDSSSCATWSPRLRILDAACAVGRCQLASRMTGCCLQSTWLTGLKLIALCEWCQLNICQDVGDIVPLWWGDHVVQVEHYHQRLRGVSSAYREVLATCPALQLQQQVRDIRALSLHMLKNLSISNGQQDQQPACAWRTTFQPIIETCSS